MCVCAHVYDTFIKHELQAGTFEFIMSLHSPQNPMRWVAFVVPILQMMKLRVKEVTRWSWDSEACPQHQC